MFLISSRAWIGAVALSWLLALTGCATAYLDGAVKDVPAADFKQLEQPRPVQVLVEFQTNGTPNARATTAVKPRVVETLKSLNLFSSVEEKPVEGGAILNVQINNVALLDDAFKKGFMTGLTLGVGGSTVTDGYICTVTYSVAGEAKPVVKVSKHAIHTALGSGVPAAGGVKQDSLADAIKTMVRQIVENAMRDVSQDPSFK